MLSVANIVMTRNSDTMSCSSPRESAKLTRKPIRSFRVAPRERRASRNRRQNLSLLITLRLRACAQACPICSTGPGSPPAWRNACVIPSTQAVTPTRSFQWLAILWPLAIPSIESTPGSLIMTCLIVLGLVRTSAMSSSIKWGSTKPAWSASGNRILRYRRLRRTIGSSSVFRIPVWNGAEKPADHAW